MMYVNFSSIQLIIEGIINILDNAKTNNGRNTTMDQGKTSTTTFKPIDKKTMNDVEIETRSCTLSTRLGMSKYICEHQIQIKIKLKIQELFIYYTNIY